MSISDFAPGILKNIIKKLEGVVGGDDVQSHPTSSTPVEQQKVSKEIE